LLLLACLCASIYFLFTQNILKHTQQNTYAVTTFGKDKAVFLRDKQNGRSVVAAFISKCVYDLLHVTRYTFTMLALFHPLSGHTADFGQWFYIIWGITFAAYGIGYIVSLVSRTDIATVIAVVTCIAFSFTSGLAPRISDVEDSWGPARVFFDLSFSRWGAEGIVSLFANVPGSYDVSRSEAVYRVKGYVLNRFGFDFGLLIVLGVFYRILAFVALFRLKTPA
jgi:hypothetical protein